jgi:hypothetical protein
LATYRFKTALGTRYASECKHFYSLAIIYEAKTAYYIIAPAN